MSTPDRATLFVLSGLPGSGKTSVAKRLEADHGVVRLCPDEWLHDLGLERAGWPARGRVERLQKDLTRRLLAAGVDVAVEDGFWMREQRDAMRALAAEADAEAVVVFLDEPLDELWRRIEARNEREPRGTFRVSRDDLEDWSRWLEVPSGDEHVVWGSDDLIGPIDPSGS